MSFSKSTGTKPGSRKNRLLRYIINALPFLMIIPVFIIFLKVGFLMGEAISDFGSDAPVTVVTVESELAKDMRAAESQLAKDMRESLPPRRTLGGGDHLDGALED